MKLWVWGGLFQNSLRQHFLKWCNKSEDRYQYD